jgi:hypothetical protein
MNESKPDINKVLFMHLVSMLAMSAIQQMGKLVDPNTGKAEINLEAAQATIDMLDMLEARTRGNLDAEETKLLKDTIMSLKMNYVESLEQKTDGGRQTTDSGEKQAESDKGKQTPNSQRPTPNVESKTEKEASAGGGADGRRQTTTEDGKRKAEEDKTPKYHKKYE